MGTYGRNPSRRLRGKATDDHMVQVTDYTLSRGFGKVVDPVPLMLGGHTTEFPNPILEGLNHLSWHSDGWTDAVDWCSQVAG